MITEKIFDSPEEAAVYFAESLPWNLLPEQSDDSALSSDDSALLTFIKINNNMHHNNKKKRITDALSRLQTITETELNNEDSEFFRDSLEHFLHLKYGGFSSLIIQGTKEDKKYYDEFLGYIKKENGSYIVKLDYPNDLTRKCPCSSPSEFCREINGYAKSRKERLTLEKAKTEMKLPDYVAELLTARM